MGYKIAPSLICMDLLHVGSQLEIIDRYGDYLHIDLMDTQFVPAMGLFPGFVKAVAVASRLPADCHLMVKRPMDYIEELAGAGVKTIVPHAEVMATGAFRILDAIERSGCRPGVAVNPATPLELILPYIRRIRRLTIMTIEPGFPGAPFIWECVDKIRQADRIRRKLGLDFEIEMDGSLGDENMEALVKAGCDVFVAGTAALFGRTGDLEADFRYLRQRLDSINR